MSNKILLVEDDIKLQDAISATLELAGFLVIATNKIEEALNILKADNIGLVISDVNLNDKLTGIDLLASIKSKFNGLPVIIITAFASIDNAVIAMKNGASDYIVKPFVPEQIVSVAQRYFINSLPDCDEPIIVDSASVSVFQIAKKLAKTNVTAMIYGESGTGKEVLANYIHKNSDRNTGPFVAINCAAIPDNMLEAILFGYEKGAFTGALQQAQGKFELANSGTIFLDEIAEMPVNLQAKILRVIQERKVERLGGKKEINLDIRIVCATNKNLKKLVREGDFREDLYFRLNVFPIQIPSLKERRADIIPIAEHIIKVYASLNNCSIPKISEKAKDYMNNLSWPGNIRELENVIQRAMILHKNNKIEVEDIWLGDLECELSFTDSEIDLKAEKDISNPELGRALKDQEYKMIMTTLKDNSGCRKKAAHVLGISDRTLRHKISKMKELGYKVPGRNNG